MNTPLTPDQLRQVDEFLYKGNKIQAIKLWRQYSGRDLKDSKDAVEARCSELQISDPVHFKKPSAGCLGLAILIIGAGALLPLCRLLKFEI